jgi:hypothetical protein
MARGGGPKRRATGVGRPNNNMTKHAAKRIDVFVDAFIRSEAVQNLTAERDRDFINEPERATRIADGGETTHREIIDDWRDAFDILIRDRRKFETPDRFIAAVHAHFDAVEAWHQQAGTLDEGAI